MPNPRMYSVTRRFDAPSIAPEALPAAVAKTLEESGISVAAGETIAIAAGSRGIGNIATMVKAVVDWVKARGARPVIIPAMGSHGGATAEGQVEVLQSYGISESTLAAPVHSSMEVIELPRGDAPVPVYIDKNASETDGVILVNRVKPHTDFHGFPESGLCKMTVIGLGKQKQALAVHSYGAHGLKHYILPAAQAIFASGLIRGGLSIIENAREETMQVEGIALENILTREPELLEIARNAMARLPVEDLDVFIVDAFGKNISGTGIDTNIIGRMRLLGEPEPASPRIKSIVARALTPASHGNSIGMGLVDVITRKFYDAIDFNATYANGITSSFLDRGKLPIIAEDDRQAFDIALRGAALGPDEEANARRARILHTRSSLHLEHFRVSETVVEELRGRDDIEIGDCGNLFGANDEMAGLS